MFEVPADAWYVWSGLAVASVLLVGLTLQLPTAAAPTADRAADAVDRVAASDHPGLARAPIERAAAIRVGPHRIALRGPGGVAHATFAYGPVVPAPSGSPLCSVARGTPPGTAFDAVEDFTDAAETARNRSPTWRPAGDALVARRLSAGEFDGVVVCG